MSAEKILDLQVNNLPPIEAPQKNEKVKSKRVDINILLNRARKIKKKETISNLIFLGLIFSLIFIAGIILAL
ncbi:hypothetical protein N8824_00595 [Candidatus Pelagibacter sp.]|nr:hypothetical protein [Candidatus Pelagibacter sp.]